MDLHLRRVDSSNLWELLDLNVTTDQDEADFVASNDVSILEAYVCLVEGKYALPFGIYDGETPVGFLMLGYDSQEGDPEIAVGNYCLWRLMVDARFQRKGYGSRAVGLALDFIRTFPCGPAKYCWLSYVPENTVARTLYQSLGFRETGELADGELVAILPLAQRELGLEKNEMGLELYVPTLDELWFYQKMMADPATMSYNAGYDPWPGYHKDTGCIDFPREEWAEWHAQWIGREPERFYAYIRRKSDGAWIGDVNFHRAPDKDWWDMGIVIYAPYRGRSYAAPALRLMLERAFRVCGVSCLHNDFETNREAAWKAHLAAGFRDMGVENGVRHLVLTWEEYLTANPQS